MTSALSASAAAPAKATPLPLYFQKVEFLNNFVINLKASCTSNITSVEGGLGASGGSHGPLPFHFLFSPSISLCQQLTPNGSPFHSPEGLLARDTTAMGVPVGLFSGGAPSLPDSSRIALK